ncbi:MAG: HlyD family efflux transporter periplasmic adaptor subunit, partial [Bacteroidetes bacterium]|nr:HlyD family efflux transporter periplasmic adaptor subunit [Bacteroidota bacterium]
EAYPAWNNYTDAFTVTGALKPLPEIKGKEKYYLSSQGVFNQYYSIKSQEARLAKYTIQAPFTGTVSMAGIKPGTLVRAGQKLGEFINTKTFEIEVSIDLNHLPFAQVGAEVMLSSNQVEGQFVGKVSRISDALDPATQSAKIIVELSEPSLKDGMYLHGYILTKEFENAVALSKAQITEKNTGFLIENGRLKEVPLSPLFVGENEIITAQLKNGDKVLRTLFMGAVNGTRVAVEGDENAPSKNGGKKPAEAQKEAE